MAAAMRVEALRKLGEMLKAAPKGAGVNSVGRSSFGGTKVDPPKEGAATAARSILQRDGVGTRRCARSRIQERRTAFHCLARQHPGRIDTTTWDW